MPYLLIKKHGHVILACIYALSKVAAHRLTVLPPAKGGYVAGTNIHLQCLPATARSRGGEYYQLPVGQSQAVPS